MSLFNTPYDPRKLNNIFFLMLFVQVVLFMVVWYYIKQNEASFFFTSNDIFAISLPIMVMLSNVIANKIYHQQWVRISEEKELVDKMGTITKAHIIQWALVQGGTLLLLVFALFEENQYYTTLALMNIIYFITLRPKIVTPDKELQANA